MALVDPLTLLLLILITLFLKLIAYALLVSTIKSITLEVHVFHVMTLVKYVSQMGTMIVLSAQMVTINQAE